MKTSFGSCLFLTVFAGLSLTQPLDTEASTLEARWGKMSVEEADREIAAYRDPRGHVSLIDGKVISYNAHGRVLKTIGVDDAEEMTRFRRATEYQTARARSERQSAGEGIFARAECGKGCGTNNGCPPLASGDGCPNCGTVNGHPNPVTTELDPPYNYYCWGDKYPAK